MLTEDKDVDDANKYVVLMTDGKSYMWNDEVGNPLTIYEQYVRRYEVQQ